MDKKYFSKFLSVARSYLAKLDEQFPGDELSFLHDFLQKTYQRYSMDTKISETYLELMSALWDLNYKMELLMNKTFFDVFEKKNKEQWKKASKLVEFISVKSSLEHCMVIIEGTDFSVEKKLDLKQKCILEIEARFMDILRRFGKLKKTYRFIPLKYLIYREKKAVVREILECYFPKTFSPFTDAHVQKRLGEIIQKVEEIVSINKCIQNPRIQETISKEIEFFEDLGLVLSSLKQGNYKAVFNGDIRRYNTYFRLLIPAFGVFTFQRMNIQLAINGMSPKKFCYRVSDHQGFGDIVFIVKMYMYYKSLLPNCTHHILANRAIKSKIKAVFPDIEFAKPDEFYDISFDFLYPKESSIAKINIHVGEYNRDSSRIRFGYGGRHYGILPNLPTAATKQEIVDYFIGQMPEKYKTQVKTIPWMSANWTLLYRSSIGKYHHNGFFDSVLYSSTPGRKICFIIGPLLEDEVHVFKEKFNDHIEYRNQGFAIIVAKFNNTILVCAKTAPQAIVSGLIKNANLPVMITGDQSLSEAINYNKPFIYACAGWKRGLQQNLAILAINLGYNKVSEIIDSEESLAKELIESKKNQDDFKEFLEVISRGDDSLLYQLKAALLAYREEMIENMELDKLQKLTAELKARRLVSVVDSLKIPLDEFFVTKDVVEKLYSIK